MPGSSSCSGCAGAWACETPDRVDVQPHALNRDGQLWGNPLYDWDAMACTGYRWWIDRMRRVLELVDRFGSLPEPARALLDSHRLRIQGKPLGIARIDASDTAVLLQFVPNPPIEPMKVLKLVQSRRNCRLAGPDRIRIEAALPNFQTRVAEIRRAFAELQP